MNKMPNTILMLLLIGSLVLNGCGGGSVYAEGGIGGTGISTGTVTAIGSIKVNGVTFDTNDAAIYIEGDRVDNPDLPDGDRESLLSYGFSEGQVVRVVGEFNADGKTGTADAVYYNDSLEGPVLSASQIDASTQSLVVMGQLVIVDSQTKPAGVNLVTFETNDIVEVSGLRDDQGHIHAGYLDKRGTYTVDDNVEIKGIIDILTAADETFTINGLTVDYSLVTPSPELQPGMQVEVKGSYNSTLVTINATSVEQDDDIGGSNDDEVEYEGIVSATTNNAFKAGDDFLMGIQVVRTNLNTVFKGGLDEDIVAGVRLEVEGYLESGILIAEGISFHDEIEIDAAVAGYSLSTDVITIDLVGLTPPITIHANDLSKIEGVGGNLNELEISLLDGTTNYVQVRGRLLSSGSGIVYAEEIKAETRNGSGLQDIKLQGEVEQIDDTVLSVTILGVEIDATNITEYEDVNNQPIEQTEFFSTVVSGNIVAAEGAWNGASIDWDKLEIEDEE